MKRRKLGQARVRETDMNSEELSGEEMDRWCRSRAKEMYGRDGEVEVDGNAVVSYGDDPGAYVAAWVWAPFEAERRDSEDG